ncbi:MAG: hypothetical protein M1837_003822 [Sclerophora amabilis]|nr:MAG: hypothetical protein M1837_003822 [Sclerophora amabilis]
MRQADNSTTPFSGKFLDFLYPTQAVALIRRLSASKGGRWNNRLPKHRTGRNRSYTSYSTDTPAVPLNDDARSSSTSIDRSERTTISGLESQHAAASAEALHGLLLSDERDKYDEAWKLFKESNSPYQAALLDYLSTSERVIDAERVEELFEHLDSKQHTTRHYYHAYTAALRLANVERAINIYEGSLQQEFQESLGLDASLAYAIIREDWRFAYDIWNNDSDELQTRSQTLVPRHEIDLETGWSGPRDQDSDAQQIQLSTKLPGLWRLAEVFPFFIDRTIALCKAYKNDGDSGILKAANHEGSKFGYFFADLVGRAIKLNPRPASIRYLLGRLTALGLDEGFLYEDMISHNLKSDQFRAAITVYMYYRSRPEYMLSPSLLLTLTKAFRTLHNLRGLEHVLDDWYRCHGVPAKRVFRIAMAEFAEHKEVHIVEELFAQYYEAYGAELTARDLNPLLHVHSRRGELKETIDMFRRIPADFQLSRGISSWRILIEAHVRAGDLDGALQSFDELHLAEMRPDQYILNTLMQMHADRGDVESVEELFEYALNRQMRITTHFCESLIQAHINNEDLERAEGVAEEVLTMNFKGSRTGTWNHILAAYAFRHDLAETQRIYQRMSEAGLRFDGMTFASLMQSLVSIGQVDAADRVMENIMPTHKVKATALHYAIVLGGYTKLKESAKILKVHNRMLRRKISPTLKANSSLIRGGPCFLGRPQSQNETNHKNKEDQSESNETTQEEQILDWIIRKTDAQESISRYSLRGYGMQELSRAFPAVYLEFLIHIVGPEKAFQKAEDLYAKYLELPRSRDVNRNASLPSKLATALMISEYRRKNYDSVAKVWQLICDRDKKRAQKWHSAATDQPGWVLPTQRYFLNVPFLYYLRSLAQQRNFDEMRRVVAQLHYDGYQLDNRSWNLYIQFIAEIGRDKEDDDGYDARIEALELCEARLMDGWRGWVESEQADIEPPRIVLKSSPTTRSYEFTSRKQDAKNELEYEREREKDSPNLDNEGVTRTKKPRTLRPIYQTIVNLARTIMDLKYREEEQEQAQGKLGDEKSAMSRIARTCPRTLRMIQSIPRSAENSQVRSRV